ncbi:MAG: serine/threonine-protein kinase, partial [Gemmatimonas sp.]
MTTIEPRWEQVTSLFDTLMDATFEERELALKRAASDDEWVVGEVRSLLAANDAADGRFDQSALSRLSPGEVEALAPPDALLTAQRVGAYNVVRKIGEGGMGAVYEAVRADDAYQQRVAIKTIARGAESSVISSRFRRERQILAELQHPNIAVLLDGGVTEAGTPYFVMEYVDGLPIDQWCRAHRSTIAQRLDLMQQVCGAVQHAHQRLVVHRDLKPQNVLVSNDGVVKLLDFGIAKLVESSGDDPRHAASVTLDGLTPMTAAYASPEQLRGEPVSTAGDVYSLGVMLYELLAGVPPFVTTGRNAVQLADAVMTQIPVTPSVACTDAASRECGESSRARLARRLSGELDAIVMMALRKEAERRYSSVEALATDVQRYLRGLPVSARSDTLGYRVRRFVGRNRWPVALSTTLALVAIASGVTIVRQSATARRESARTARVSEFLQAVLGAGDATSMGGMLPRLGPRASVGALMDSALRRVPTEFADDPAVRARLYLTIGSSLISQSRMRDASVVLDSAIALTRATYGERTDMFVLASLEAGTAAMHRNQTARARELVSQARAVLIATDQSEGDLSG